MQELNEAPPNRSFAGIHREIARSFAELERTCNPAVATSVVLVMVWRMSLLEIGEWF
jgi:hypothetical protein